VRVRVSRNRRVFMLVCERTMTTYNCTSRNLSRASCFPCGIYGATFSMTENVIIKT
jgi:hypothetical protein